MKKTPAASTTAAATAPGAPKRASKKIALDESLKLPNFLSFLSYFEIN